MHPDRRDRTWITRRRMLGTAAAGGAALVAAACTDESARSDASGAGAAPTTVALHPGATTLGEGDFSLFDDGGLNFQTLFALGGAGMNAEVGEVITAVEQASASGAGGAASYQTLFDSMSEMGNRVLERAAEAARRGHAVSARSQYLRAAQYYNQALYWVLGTDTPGREAELYTAMDDAFVAAAELMEPAWQRLEIRYDAGTMTGWFMRPPGASGRRPTMVINNGSDGQNVDMVAQGGAAALERGYNVVIFEGPGQGNQLFIDNVPFRPDWQNVVGPVFDSIARRDDVDARAIVLRGISFGGLLVPRAAVHDDRFAAIVADPGSVSSWRSFPEVVRSFDDGTREQVNSTWATISAQDLTASDEFNLKKRLEVYSAEAHDQARRGEVPSDFYGLARTIRSFDLAEDEARRIRTPALVLDYEGEQFFTGQARELYDALGSADKHYVELTKDEGAEYHCAPMAPQRVAETVYDWVAEQLAR